MHSNKRGDFVIYGEGENPDKNGDIDFSYIATDYNTWLIEYVCVDIVPNQYYVDSISIKSRTPELDESTIALITGITDGIGYDPENLYFVHQCRICPYNTMPELIEQ